MCRYPFGRSLGAVWQQRPIDEEVEDVALDTMAEHVGRHRGRGARRRNRHARRVDALKRADVRRERCRVADGGRNEHDGITHDVSNAAELVVVGVELVVGSRPPHRHEVADRQIELAARLVGERGRRRRGLVGRREDGVMQCV